MSNWCSDEHHDTIPESYEVHSSLSFLGVPYLYPGNDVRQGRQMVQGPRQRCGDHRHFGANQAALYLFGNPRDPHHNHCRNKCEEGGQTSTSMRPPFPKLGSYNCIGPPRISEEDSELVDDAKFFLEGHRNSLRPCSRRSQPAPKMEQSH